MIATFIHEIHAHFLHLTKKVQNFTNSILPQSEWLSARNKKKYKRMNGTTMGL